LPRAASGTLSTFRHVRLGHIMRIVRSDIAGPPVCGAIGGKVGVDERKGGGGGLRGVCFGRMVRLGTPKR
jgi:hypothetical protein